MTTLIEQIAVSIYAVGFLYLLFYIAVDRPIIAVGFLFIIFTFAWRTCSTAFIDLMGPVYASQLMRNVGPGNMTLVHVTAYLLTLAPFFYLLDESQVSRWKRAKTEEAGTKWITLGDVGVLISIVVLTWLYIDMLRGGIIPLFTQMERFDFTNLHAGMLHRFFIRYGNLVVFVWGLLFAATRLREGRTDIRYLGILGLTFVYFFLTGNRFSAFYSLGSFFVLPYAAVIAVSRTAGSVSRTRSGARIAKLLRERFAIAAMLFLAVLLSAVGIYNNLVNVRASDSVAPLTRFFERVLVQPSEIGWVSYERVFLHGNWQPAWAFHALFVDPIDPKRNTTVQYLMKQTIGEPRTADHLDRGFQFAGGFPEIYFELFGPYLAWPMLLLAGCITAFLVMLILRGIVEGHYATAFWAAYVLYGFLVMYIGGMLNFLLPWTYWLKITALVTSIVLERSLDRAGVSLAPWFLVRRPQWSFSWRGRRLR